MIDSTPQENNSENKEKLSLINQIIIILEKPTQSEEDKKIMIQKFEELNEKGGLPDKIMS